MFVLLGSALGHGIWGHVHVTGWAVENMPDDELRQFLLSDPEVFNALLFGAVFADTGYANDDPAARAYSEHTHWEPFIEDYIAWVQVNDPPPWDTLESKKRVAFLMGAASHGLQDSMFDSLFLYQVEERDGADQDATDPGTDGFLVLDDHIRFHPQEEVPIDTVLELYAGLPEEVTREIIEESVGLTLPYVDPDFGLILAEGLGNQYAPVMPWGREHYMDPDVPGSLRAEIYPTMRYQQAIWARLHGELSPDEVTVYAFPSDPRRLRSGDPSVTDSWVTLIFGAGVSYEGDLVELLDSDGQVVPFEQANGRWGPGHTRLIRLLPTEALEPGGWYTARLRSGVELIDGRVSSQEFEVAFQVACLDEDEALCPEVEAPVASIDGIPEEPSPQDAEGCGCASGGPAGVAVFGLVALAARRSRRDERSAD